MSDLRRQVESLHYWCEMASTPSHTYVGPDADGWVPSIPDPTGEAAIDPRSSKARSAAALCASVLSGRDVHPSWYRKAIDAAQDALRDSFDGLDLDELVLPDDRAEALPVRALQEARWKAGHRETRPVDPRELIGKHRFKAVSADDHAAVTRENARLRELQDARRAREAA